MRFINLLILFGIRRNCLRSGRSPSFYPSIRRVIRQTVVIIEVYHFCQLCKNFYPTSCCKSYLHMQRKLLGIISVDFDAAGQLLIIYSAFVKYLRKNWNTIRQCIICLQTSRKPMIQSEGRSCIIFALSLVSPFKW